MKTIVIGLGEIAVSGTPGEVIKTMALGSCVGVVCVAPRKKVAGMAHVVLADSNIAPEKAKLMPGYFADTGIPELLSLMRKHGVESAGEMVVKLAGGANVMDSNGYFNIGKRNILSVRKYLWRNRLAPRAEDVGGSISRTVWVDVASGRVFVNSPGRGEWEL